MRNTDTDTLFPKGQPPALAKPILSSVHCNTHNRTTLCVMRERLPPVIRCRLSSSDLPLLRALIIMYMSKNLRVERKKHGKKSHSLFDFDGMQAETKWMKTILPRTKCKFSRNTKALIFRICLPKSSKPLLFSAMYQPCLASVALQQRLWPNFARSVELYQRQVRRLCFKPQDDGDMDLRGCVYRTVIARRSRRWHFLETLDVVFW
jgi:hypothetical protein